MLYFANYSGDPDSNIVRQIWTRLVEQAISRGGIAEASSVLKRVASQIYPGDGVVLPLDTPCLLLEKAALVCFLTKLLFPLGSSLHGCWVSLQHFPLCCAYCHFTCYFLSVGETGFRSRICGRRRCR